MNIPRSSTKVPLTRPYALHIYKAKHYPQPTRPLTPGSPGQSWTPALKGHGTPAFQQVGGVAGTKGSDCQKPDTLIIDIVDQVKIKTP